jgi:hypothetical protein
MAKPFNQQVMVTKGQIGERIFDEIALQQYYVYKPTEGSRHPFDRLLINRAGNGDFGPVAIVDVKAINHRRGRLDTGVSISHYREYQALSDVTGLPVYLVFVDERAGKIYGNLLDELSRPMTIARNNKQWEYPLIEDLETAVGGQVIYFSLVKMQHLAYLTDEQINELRAVNNEGYKRDMEHRRDYQQFERRKNDIVEEAHND